MMKSQRNIVAAVAAFAIVAGSAIQAQPPGAGAQGAAAQRRQEARERLQNARESRSSQRSGQSQSSSQGSQFQGRSLQRQSVSPSQSDSGPSQRRSITPQRTPRVSQPESSSVPSARRSQAPESSSRASELRERLQERRSNELKIEDSQPAARQTPTRRRNVPDTASESDDSPRNAARERLENLRKQRQGQDDSPASKIDITEPAKTPAAGRGETSRNAARERLENLRKQRQGQDDTPSPSVDTAEPKTTPAAGRGESARNAARERLENLRKERQGENDKPDQAGTPDKAGSPQTERAKTRLEQLKERRGQTADKPGEATETPGATNADEAIRKLRGGRQTATEGTGKGQEALAARQELIKKRQDELAGKQADRAELRETRTNALKELREGKTAERLAAKEKATLIGANLAERFDAKRDGKSFLSKEDLSSRFGRTERLRRDPELTKDDLEDLRRGRFSDKVREPWGDFGRLRRPLGGFDRDARWLPPAINNINITNIQINNITNINNFGYWDGRSYYNHDYAFNLFVNLGHTRIGGFDGMLVGGRYYSYGFGWIDGCYDYGGSRCWVPGFWAPYTTTECCACEVWIPPVYDWVWTGCCWEQVQVDGGYFDPYSSGECHTVTRWHWVPGHYEYYYV